MTLRFDRLFVVVCLFMWAPSAMAQEKIEDVFSQELRRLCLLTKSPVAEFRLEGARGLGVLSHHLAQPALLPLMSDADPVVRREAVIALGNCGGWEAIPGLILLVNDPCWDVREHACIALRRMTAQDFGTDGAKWDKWQQSGSREEKARQPLAELKTEDAGKRKKALAVLKCFASPGDEAAVLAFLQSHPKLSADERNLGLSILERIGGKASVPYLTAHAKGGNPAAAWALGQTGGDEAEQALLAGAQRGGIPGQAFLFNLDRLRSAKCEPFFPRLLYAFGLVTFRGYPDDADYPATPVQRAAANLILRSGKAPELVDAILGEMEGKPRNVAEPLKKVLEAMRPELKPGFVRNDGQTTSEPLAALPYIVRDRKLIPRLIPLLRHPAFVPRVYVALTLGRMQAREAIPEMLKIIDEGYPFSDSTALASGKHFNRSQTVRWLGYFAIALGCMQCEEARLALEKLASGAGRSRDIRYGAVVGLDFMGSPKSLPILKRVADADIILMVRTRASEAAHTIEATHQEAKCP